jgi:uncharacterized protein (TIGR03083 family)
MHQSMRSFYPSSDRRTVYSMKTAPLVDWDAAQAAVAAAAPRVSDLLRSVTHPDVPALGSWSVTDVAIHVSLGLDAITAMARGGGGLLDDVWALAGLSSVLVAGEDERDLAQLADRIAASAAALLAVMTDVGHDESRRWLVQGIDFNLSSLLCHALNELWVHGRDIALADGRKWRIPRSDAALIVDGFLVPSIGGLGRQMVDQDNARGVAAVYDIRVRGGRRAVWRFDDGDLTVTPGPPTGPVDCHLSVDPEAFLLVAWGRLHQGGPIAKGQLLAWGRKPWLGLKLRSLLRNP